VVASERHIWHHGRRAPYTAYTVNWQGRRCSICRYRRTASGARLMCQACRPTQTRRGEDPTQLYGRDHARKLSGRSCTARTTGRRARDILPAAAGARRRDRVCASIARFNVRGFRGSRSTTTAACKLADDEKSNNSGLATICGAGHRLPSSTIYASSSTRARHNMYRADKRAVTAVLGTIRRHRAHSAELRQATAIQRCEVRRRCR